MKADEILQQAYQMATGDDEQLPTGDPNYSRYLRVMNSIQSSWTEEKLMVAGERWQSLERVTSETLESDKNYISLPENAKDMAISPLNYHGTYVIKNYGTENEERIMKLRGVNAYNFSLLGDAQPVYNYDFVNKRILLKKDTLDELRKENTTLVFVYYVKPQKIESGDSIIQVDNPNWLTYMLAGEIARNDIIQSGQYGNLIAMAQNEMEHMKSVQRKARFEFEENRLRGRYD